MFLIHRTHILGDANVMFYPKYACRLFSPHHNITRNWVHNLCITLQIVVSLPHQCIVKEYTGTFVPVSRILVIYRGDWLSIKFCENDSFRKLFLFFWKYLSVSRWNLPGYFSVSFRFPQVTEFGKSTAIYLADSFCQLYSALWSAWQEDLNDPQERCTMARTSCAGL